MATLKIGDPLPELAVISTNSSIQNLRDFAGHPLLLYFYPKDNTPGCTQEGTAFRDLHAEFSQRDCRIVGVSRDTLGSHQKFCDKYQFPFELLSDSNETLCNLFDVIKQKSMYGKQVMGIERSSFLFDADGKLVREWRKVKVKGHAEAILEQLQSLPH